MVDWIVYPLVLLLSLSAIALNIVSLPGNWVMLVAAAALSWAHGWDQPTVWALGIMLLVLLAGEAIELLGSVVGARKFGASRSATVAAIAGAIIGAIVGTPVWLMGNIVGAILGAFLAAWAIELMKRRTFKAATWAAVGAALGRTLGLGAKLTAGVAVWVMLAWTAWPG